MSDNPHSSSSIRGLVSDNLGKVRPEHRAFVLVNGVLALFLLGVLVASRDIATAKWATLGTLLLLALNMAFVFVLSRSRQSQKPEGDYDRRRQAAESVNGDWWQVILVSGDSGEILVEGLTIVNIRLNVPTGSYGLDGELFDEQGKSRAQWRAEAVAIKTLAPVELFYRFAGFSFRGPVLSDPTGDVTGIGVFTFDPAEAGAETSTRGSGWFATGYVEKLKFGRRRDIRLIRIKPDEQAVLDGAVGAADSSDRQALIAQRHFDLASRYGTAIGQRRD